MARKPIDGFHARLPGEHYTNEESVVDRLLYHHADLDEVHIAARTVAELVACGATEADCRPCVVYRQEEDVPEHLLLAADISFDHDGWALLPVYEWESRTANALERIHLLTDGRYIQETILDAGWIRHDNAPLIRVVNGVPSEFEPCPGSPQHRPEDYFGANAAP